MRKRLARLIGVSALCIVAGGHAGAAEVLTLLGRGVQVYRCEAAAGAFAWTLRGPDAALLGGDGRVVGHHFAGPSWQATDGSLVVGEVVASGTPPAGAAGAIPWLVLRAKSHAGAGSFATVTYIVRGATAGGVAPAGGCDAAHAGAEARVAYTATYTLFGVR